MAKSGTKPFTEKQQRFVEEYLIDLNATQAAIRAGYSEKTAHAIGAENLTKPLIAKAIVNAKQERSEEVIADANWVLKRLKILAEFNIHKFISKQKDGTAVYDFSTATEDDWYCIGEYTTETISKGMGDEKYDVDKVRIKSIDKLKALELAGKHVDIQAFSDRVEISMDEELASWLKR